MKQIKTIVEFKDGEILDKINAEFQKCCENIADKNTSLKPRKIKCEIVVTPDAKRQLLQVAYTTTSTLQPQFATTTAIQMSMTAKGIQAMELTGNADGQTDVFGNTHETKVFTMPLKVVNGEGK